MLLKLAVLFPGTTSVLSGTGGLAGFENGFLNIFEIFGAAAEILQNLFGFLNVSYGFLQARHGRADGAHGGVPVAPDFLHVADSRAHGRSWTLLGAHRRT